MILLEEKYLYTIFETPYGNVGIVKTLKGLYMVLLPQKTTEDVKRKLKLRLAGRLIKDDFFCKGIKKKLIDYFSRKFVRFNEAIDFSGASDFDKRVWSAASKIPKGEVRSYGWVAKSIGNEKAKRAVGRALSRNRLPIVIPCHRVIQKDGDIGGFSSGVPMKRLLLKIEGRVL